MAIKNNILTLVFFLFLVFNISFISSVAPSTTIINDYGVTVDTLLYDNLKVNDSFYLHVHAFNSTNGLNLSNSSLNCFSHLYDYNGKEIFTVPLVYLTSEGEWYYNISGSNFSKIGSYSIISYCVGTSIGGSQKIFFEVTPSGQNLSMAQAFVYISGLMLAIGIFLLLLYPAIKIKFKNIYTPEGKIISINTLKWFKVGAIALDYVILMFIFGLSASLSKNFLYVSSGEQLFMWLYNLMLSFSLPIAILAIVLGFMIFIKDYALKKIVKRHGGRYNV